MCLSGTPNLPKIWVVLWFLSCLMKIPVPSIKYIVSSYACSRASRLAIEQGYFVHPKLIKKSLRLDDVK